ncbi:sulfatase-like hydrolase/transferase [Polaribacter sp.]|uniref:sulfatase n=1 Tax=Polaribacter sp. TaxID=1920175 RepID=UPI003F6CF998
MNLYKLNYIKYFWLIIFTIQFSKIYAQKEPNFILILTDDQGWSHTSLKMDKNNPASKSDFLQTPNIEKLGKQGMRFSRGYAASPVCAPSRFAIQFGKTTARINYTSIIGSYKSDVNYQQKTIAKLLKKANKNYSTAHFGKWHMEVHPKEFGYDVSDGNTQNMYGSFFSKQRNLRWKGFTHKDPKRIFSLTQTATKFMADQVKKNKPFFMQVSHYANHDHLMARPETLAKFKKQKRGKIQKNAMYAAMTADLDEGIGLLLKKVKELGIENNTYIIFTSDNGGVPRLPPNRNQYKTSLNYPLQRGKWDLTEGGIRVPFLVVGPGIKQNSQTNIPVVGYDILPTILELSGNPQIIPKNIDGTSFASLLKGNETQINLDRKLIFHYPHYNHFGLGEPHSVIIKDNYKLIKMRASKKSYLFDIKNDVAEQTNLKQTRIKVAQQLELYLENYLKDVGAEKMQNSKNWLRGEGAVSEKFPLDTTKLKPKGVLDGFNTYQGIIDVSNKVGIANHKASGFLWGIHKNAPHDTLLKPLQPKLYRGRITEKNGSPGISALKRMKNLGAAIQLVVSDEYNQKFQHNKRNPNISGFSYGKIDKWPGDEKDWSLWEDTIEECYQKLKSVGLAKDIQWDFWEEPNHFGWFRPYSRKIENHLELNKKRFFETYKKGVLKVKSLYPNAIIVGPSINKFDPSYLKDFLIYAKKNNVLPNYLAWHEIIEQHYPQQIPIHVNKIRFIMKQNGITEIPIQINKFVSEKRQTSVSQQILYLSNLEKAKVHSAARACWREKENNNIFNGWSAMLNGLLTAKDFKPRATYWPYRYYGAMKGDLVYVKNLPQRMLFDGMANLDNQDKKLRVLLGRTGNLGFKKLKIRVKNLNQVSWLKNKKKLKVTIKNIQNSKWNHLPEPKITFQEFITVNSNYIDIKLLNFIKQEGIFIEIE